MKLTKLLSALVVSLAIVVPFAFAQNKEEPSFPEQVIEGVRGFFKNLFGGEAEKPPAPALEPAAPKPAEPVAAKPAAPPVTKAAPEPEPVRATPAAKADPASLHAIVAKGDYEAASRLIGQGADIEARDPGTGASVLHYAVMRGNPEILQLLLDRGADVNSRTKNGTTPLHTAVLYNRFEVAEKLLNKGAEVNATSASGATPLALATAARNRVIAEMLRSRGGI